MCRNANVLNIFVFLYFHHFLKILFYFLRFELITHSTKWIAKYGLLPFASEVQTKCVGVWEFFIKKPQIDRIIWIS